MDRQVVRKPFRPPRQVIKETQEAEMENIGRDIAGQKESPQQIEGVDCHGEWWAILARKERTESVDGGHDIITTSIDVTGTRN